MSKYTIHSTKEDYKKIFATIAELEDKLHMSLDWKKIKRARYDSLATMVSALERRLK
tara:strand:+ start:902 stop:1072 length:171 start_codon:yes stop_codon:yes gene_type:complete